MSDHRVSDDKMLQQKMCPHLETYKERIFQSGNSIWCTETCEECDLMVENHFEGRYAANGTEVYPWDKPRRIK